MSVSLATVIGACIGAAGGLYFMGNRANKASAQYPVLQINVPEGAENSPEWQQWAQSNGYNNKGGGLWVKGTGMLTSATEIRFEGNRMNILESVNYLFGIARFAINAPVAIGKPVRKMKIKALNRLLEQWQLPPITFN